MKNKSAEPCDDWEEREYPAVDKVLSGKAVAPHRRSDGVLVGSCYYCGKVTEVHYRDHMVARTLNGPLVKTGAVPRCAIELSDCEARQRRAFLALIHGGKSKTAQRRAAELSGRSSAA